MNWTPKTSCRQRGEEFLPTVDLDYFEKDPELIRLVPAYLAWHYKILPLYRGRKIMTVAMAEPIDEITNWMPHYVAGYMIVPVPVEEEKLLEAIEKYYGPPPSTNDLEHFLFSDETHPLPTDPTDVPAPVSDEPKPVPGNEEKPPEAIEIYDAPQSATNIYGSLFTTEDAINHIRKKYGDWTAPRQEPDPVTMVEENIAALHRTFSRRPLPVPETKADTADRPQVVVYEVPLPDSSEYGPYAAACFRKDSTLTPNPPDPDPH